MLYFSVMTVEHFYLSPHLDDAGLSCGAQIHSQTSRGDRVVIWTICAGDPPKGPLSEFAAELHQRWGVSGETAVRGRQAEDAHACRVLGAEPLHASIPDAIYRRHPDTGAPLYPNREAIFGPLHPAEGTLVEALAADFRARLSTTTRVYCPLAVGNHVDHQLVRRAGGVWGGEAAYYEDYPYAAAPQALEAALTGGEWRATVVPITGQALNVKLNAIDCYASQIGSFWPDAATMRAEVGEFAKRMAGGSGLAERYWYYR